VLELDDEFMSIREPGGSLDFRVAGTRPTIPKVVGDAA
jgi:hypothetical protein